MIMHGEELNSGSKFKRERERDFLTTIFQNKTENRSEAGIWCVGANQPGKHFRQRPSRPRRPQKATKATEGC